MSFSDNYEKLTVMGQGVYGVVSKARDKLTGNIVAIKEMHASETNDGIAGSTLREIVFLRSVSHRNVIRLQDVFFEIPKLFLVFECCEFDMQHYIRLVAKENETIPPQDIQDYLRQLLEGLAYLHSNNIMHRDIKPQNLLLTDQNELRIADFGLARVFGIPVKKYRHEAATLWYRPPDQLLGSVMYEDSLDLWSAGCVFAELIVLKPLFPGQTDKDQLQKIFSLLGSPSLENMPQIKSYPGFSNAVSSGLFSVRDNDAIEYVPIVVTSSDDDDSTVDGSSQPDSDERLKRRPPGPQTTKNWRDWLRTHDVEQRISRDGVDLLLRMLTYDPQKRITAAEALRHPFFQIRFPHSAQTPTVSERGESEASYTDASPYRTEDSECEVVHQSSGAIEIPEMDLERRPSPQNSVTDVSSIVAQPPPTKNDSNSPKPNVSPPGSPKSKSFSPAPPSSGRSSPKRSSQEISPRSVVVEMIQKE